MKCNCANGGGKVTVIVGGSIFGLPLRKKIASDFVRAYVQRPIFARRSDEHVILCSFWCVGVAKGVARHTSKLCL